jgi:hypothetical protein
MDSSRPEDGFDVQGGVRGLAFLRGLSRVLIRVLQSLRFGTTPLDPVVLLGVCGAIDGRGPSLPGSSVESVADRSDVGIAN